MKHNGHSPSQEAVIAKVAEVPSEAKITPESSKFYSPVYKADSVTDVTINYTELNKLLRSFGFRRYDMGKEFIYIRIQKQVIEEVEPHQIGDFFFAYLEGLPESLGEIKREILIEKFNRNPSHYFCDNRLKYIKPDSAIVFNTDCKNESYVYFQNGFVKCGVNGYELHDYKDLEGCIWNTQIIQRPFVKTNVDIENISSLSNFAQFVYNSSGEEPRRFKCFCSMIGFGLHRYNEGKRKAIILTDSKISEKAEGRTGKGLITVGLSHVRKLCEVDGKYFDPKDKHRYSAANLDTQIIHLSDVVKNFDVEYLFNDITGGVTVDKKNKEPFKIHPKIIISANKTIKIEGASAIDRVEEVELSDHYSHKHSPMDDFGESLFDDWKSDEQWNSFYNYMMHCLCIYLKEGFLKPTPINLYPRKQLDNTNPDFVEFMNNKFLTGGIKPKVEFESKELHSLFLKEYTEYNEDKKVSKPQTFTTWIKTFVEYSNKYEIAHERRSNGKRFFTLQLSPSYQAKAEIQNEEDLF